MQNQTVKNCSTKNKSPQVYQLYCLKMFNNLNLYIINILYTYIYDCNKITL